MTSEPAVSVPTSADYLAAIDELIALEEKDFEGDLTGGERTRWRELSKLLFGPLPDERRRHSRVEAERVARIEGPGLKARARATSISAGGLFLETPDVDPSLLGRQLDVVLALPISDEQTLQFRVEVCRVVPPGGRLAAGLGVRFLELSRDQSHYLLEYLRVRLMQLVEISREKYQFFFEHSADLAMLLTTDGRVREVNAPGAELLGVSPEPLLGVALDELVIPEAADAVRSALQATRDGTRVPVALRFARPDGTLVPVDAVLSVFKVGSLRLGTMLVGHDRSLEDDLEKQARRAERRLFQADKLATLGQVTAGIAHDINNPLAYILSNLGLLHEYVGPLLEMVRRTGLLGDASPVDPALLDQIDQELAELVDDSLEGSQRIGELVRDLRDFARVDSQAEVRIDVNQCLDAAERLTRNLIRHRAHVRRDYASPLPPTCCNFGRLSQVFLNLLTNAAQAFDCADVEKNWIRLATDLEDGRLRVRVSDNGRGIPPETVERLFEPFFTTRRAEGGTGLGLAIAKENIEGLGGHLTVESRPGEGTTFTVRLPVRRPSEPSLKTIQHVVTTRRVRVLVIDDDAMLLRGLERALRRSFEVTTSASAKGALDLARDGAFDVVLCDVMMPEMSGIEFHRRLEAIEPSLARRTVFMTGGTFAPEEERRLCRLTNVVLKKPTPLDELVETLAAVGGALEGEAPPGRG